MNSVPQSAILKDFQNQEYRFTIPKSRTWHAEEQEEWEEEKQAIAKRYTNAVIMDICRAICSD